MFSLAVLLCMACNTAVVGVDLMDNRVSSSAVRLRSGKHSDVNNGNTVTVGAHRRSLVVQNAEIVQQLVICNAYTSHVPLQIVRVRTRQSLNGEVPLEYKQCAEYSVPLQEGDQLDFKAGKLEVGTFYATGLPKYKGSLVLIAHRRHADSKGVSFESHAFADLENPQLVVIDTYRGKETGSIKILERAASQQNGNSGASGPSLMQAEDDLSFNSVVAVKPGAYVLSLKDNSSHIVASVPLDASKQGKYVVMRVGGSSTKSGSFPQALIVYPNGCRMGMSVTLAFLAVISVVVLNIMPTDF